MASVDQVAVEGQRNEIVFVRRNLFRPQGLWDDSEENAPVPVVFSGANQGDAKAPKFEGSRQPFTNLRPRSNRSAASSARARPRS